MGTGNQLFKESKHFAKPGAHDGLLAKHKNSFRFGRRRFLRTS